MVTDRKDLVTYPTAVAPHNSALEATPPPPPDAPGGFQHRVKPLELGPHEVATSKPDTTGHSHMNPRAPDIKHLSAGI
jgi:hypothetical protein